MARMLTRQTGPNGPGPYRASAWLLISLAFILDALKAPKHLIHAAVTILLLEMALLAVTYWPLDVLRKDVGE